MQYRLLSALFAGCLLAGCGSYDEISPEAYQYSKALYSICNRSDQARLDDFAVRLAAAEENHELTSTEFRWINDIVATAQAGEWPAATKEARRLMEDQIRRP